MEPIEVIVVGRGGRARAWLDVLERSPRTRPVAVVSRDGKNSFARPGFTSLDAALAAFPSARVAVTLPPLAGTQVALQLARVGRASVVEAPLAGLLADADLEAEARRIQVAHGWATLAGVSWVEKLRARHPDVDASLELRGLPEASSGDLREVLVHGVTLIRRIFPDAALRDVRLERESLIETDWTCGNSTIRARLHTHGEGGELRLRGPQLVARWGWNRFEESWEVSRSGGSGAVRRSQPILPGESRGLFQLLEPQRAGGSDLIQARTIMRLVRAVEAQLGRDLPVGQRALRASAAAAERDPGDLQRRLGLSAVPAGEPAAALSVEIPREPLEYWPFRAGIKPVAFLTMHPEEEPFVREVFGDAHIERRERRVHVGGQDAWVDRRDVGEPRIELYISRDPDLAREAVRLQAEADPTASLARMGELMGYPSCCVEAFAAQADRSNNSANRYASAARTTGERWPWELNNLFWMPVAFYPCSYRCEHALAYARAALGELERAHPGAVERLRRVLARPVLYFEHGCQIVFDGEVADGALRYRGLQTNPGAPPAFAAFAGAMERGDSLVFDASVLRVLRGGETLFTVERSDPALGFVAPFGA